jgi:predicted MPP superfamily phosphohydrolase
MKTVLIGDLHGRSTWKLIVYQEKPDRVVFIGDYFDSFDISGVEQIANFKEIIEYKKSTNTEVIMLVGNHDHHYFPEIGYTGTSGYQTNIAPSINQVIDENREHLQMAYRFDDVLCTHAGVSETFMDITFGKDGWKTEDIVELLNEKFKYQPKTFVFNGRDSYGDNVYQTPIWIRPRSLMADNYNKLRKEVIQVVGHTQQFQIDIQGKATGGRYYFIDTLGTSGEYLIYQDGQFTIGKTLNN